jgi:hypothetical protein
MLQHQLELSGWLRRQRMKSLHGFYMPPFGQQMIKAWQLL